MARDKVRRVDLSPDEYIAGTFGQLTPLQFAVYWAACLLIYSRGGAVDNDADRFVAAFKWNAELKAERPRYRRQAVRDAIDQLLTMRKLRLNERGQLTNGRALDELGKAIDRIDKARMNGARGGRP